MKTRSIVTILILPPEREPSLARSGCAGTEAAAISFTRAGQSTLLRAGTARAPGAPFPEAGQCQDARGSIQRNRGYLLIECLVYILVLFILLGVSYLALFRCISNSVALRRNAEDISKALHIGECWRADVRSATGNIRLEQTNSVQVLHIPTRRGQTIYCFATNTISRSYNGGPWSQLLTNVASSTMTSERRKTVTAWYWNLELQTRRNNSRISPLFTFMSVPETASPK